MPLLDLLGTVAGAAFLAGSVTLALRIDRREATGAGRLPEVPAPSAAPAGTPRLRAVPGLEE